MAFNTLGYFLFLPLTLVAYYRLPARFQNAGLLVASLLFYLFSAPKMLLVLLFGTLVTWRSALFCAGAETERTKKRAACVGIVLLAALLAFFKYFNFFSPLLCRIFGVAYEREPFLLAFPLGISFYTFTAIAYLADVSGGKVTVRKSFFDVLLFLSFFGTVSSGPILRATDFFGEIEHPRRFDAGATTLALANIGLGLFYKVAISDVLGIYVNAVYDNLHAYSGLTLSAATLGFSAQLFFDFAGYSLLALGTAGLLGIRVTRNFNAPYFSRSLKEFWSRWHISLSSWLRDYIYIPLGGNRHRTLCKYRNHVLTFVISGIWHGAGLSFILWGLLHGVLQVLGELLQPARSACLSKLHLSRRSRFVLLMQWLSTAFMVNELWIFFRADTISDALYLLQHQFFNLSLSTFYNETLAVLSSAFNPLR
ncbi:MAG: MBOAT family O-acyltransferase, partial [Pygmaiobacter sp.]